MGGTIRAVMQRDLKPTSRQGLCHFLCLRIWILRKARGLETSHDNTDGADVFFVPLF